MPTRSAWPSPDKRRGLLSTYGTQCMTETGVHLVDHVIPRGAVRQWVLSFSIPLRFLLAVHPQLLSPVLRVVNRAIWSFMNKQAD